MRAVEYQWDFGSGYDSMAEWPEEQEGADWVCNSLSPGERLNVRMDNGQLCTFKRRAKNNDAA